jgi:hypothetical protein
MAEDREYEIGYGKPPKATQFKAGQSGNPKGRPKGSMNAATMMQQIVAEPVSVVEKGGREKTMPMLEVLLRRMVNKAATGDLKAIPMVLTLVEQGSSDPGAEAPSAEKDHRHLQDVLLKMRNDLGKGESSAKEDE